MKLTKLFSLTFLVILLHSLLALELTSAQTLPSDFNEELVVSGLGTATDLKPLPDGKILVTEKSGKIFLVDPNTATKSDFMTLGNVDGGFERGLLTVLLDPDFETNNYFYLFYTTSSNRVRISRFTSLGATGDLNSETVIWESTHVYDGSQLYHFGGAMDFANDGTLFFCTGDMLQESKTQDLQEEHGKLMRINKDGTIPADNPFYNDGAAAGPNGELPEIYAWGLRNPFKGYYDKQSEIFIIGEVGGNDASSSWEDIHYGKKGVNYGWPDCGESGRNADGSCQGATFEDPIYTYPHIVGRGHSLTGGVVYRNGNFPTEYQGVYFFTDYAQSWIRYLKLDQNMMPVGEAVQFKPPTGFKGNVALTQGTDGSLYYIDINDFENGLLKKISYVGPEVPIITEASASTTNGNIENNIIFGTAPLEVNFEGDAFIGNGTELTYTWDFGDGNSANAKNTTHTYTESGSYKARLSVTNTNGLSAFSEEISIVVGEPPIVNITSPIEGNKFLAGEQITFSATATDDGPLDDSNYSWNIVFLHNDHTHPGISNFNAASGTFNIPVDGHSFHDNTGFIFSLTVTDADGISTTESVTIFPEKTNISLETVPSGLRLIVANQPRTTPYVVDELIGFEAEITAISPQALNSKKYVFKEWSNGATRTQLYKNPETNSTLTAIFEEVESSFLEAEDNYEVVADVDELPITTVFSDFTSQGRAIGIYNPGDKIKISFDVAAERATATPGKYIINTRVRSGTNTFNDSYWPDGYKFTLDGADITLVGDPNSIEGPSNDLGGSHWGTMVSDEIILTEGTHDFTIEAVNGFSVVDYIELVKVSNDIPTTPTVSLESNTDRTVSIVWTESTDADGVDFYEVYRDGVVVGTTTKTKYTFDKLSPETAYDFIVKAVDIAGSVSEASNTLAVTTSATMDAGIIITSPESGEQVTGPDVEISYAIFGDPTTYDHIVFQIDDEPAKYAHNLDGGSFLFTNVAPGTHTVTAFVAMGHNVPLENDQALKTVTFDVVYTQNAGENAGVVITSPKNQSKIFTNSIDINYTLYGDQSTFSALEVIVDDLPAIKVTDLSGTYQVDNLSNGNHTISINLLDDTDTPLTNPEASTSVAFKVYAPTDIPTMLIDSPENNATLYNNDVLVEYTIMGSNTLYDHFHLKLDGQDYIPVFNLTGSYLLENLSVGEHTLRLYLVDTHHAPLPNPEAEATVTFTIKDPSDAPSVTITGPEEDAFVYGNEMEITYELSGELANVDHIHFYLDDQAYQPDYTLDGTFVLKNITEGEHTLIANMAYIQHQLFTNAEAADTIKFTSKDVLNAPSNLKGEMSDDYKSISLSWDAMQGDVSYQLEEAESANGDFSMISTISNENTYEHTIANRGPKHYFRLKALFGNIESTFTETIEVATNTLPIGNNFTAAAAEDNTLFFNANTFKSNFSDADAIDTLNMVIITSLPDTGQLILESVPVSIGQEISSSLLGQLSYVPTENWFGQTSFDYKVSDGIENSELDGNIEITINAVNDRPFNLEISNVQIEENNVLGAEIGSFSVEDVDNTSHSYEILNKTLTSGILKIEDDKLIATRIFDYELQNSYLVEVEANDGSGGRVSRSFNVEILDEIDEPLSLSQALKSEGIEIYPNPVSQAIVINMDNNRFGSYTFEVIDITGKNVFMDTFSKESLRDSFKLDLDFLDKGVYLLRINHASNSVTHKFIKN